MLQNHENENLCKIGKKKSVKITFKVVAQNLLHAISIVKQLLDENDIMHLL